MSTISDDEADEVTIDGEGVQEITMDGDVVWTAEEMIDDFESYSLGNTDLMGTYSEGTGDSSNFEVSSYGLLGSSQSLTVSGDSTQMISAMRGDGSNLENYVDNGDTFRFAFEFSQFDSGRRVHVWYGCGHYNAFSHGGYVVWIESDNSRARIREYESWSSSSVLPSDIDISSYNPGETWEAEVAWDGSSHTLSIYDHNGSLVGSASGTDGTHSNNDGTIGYGIDDAGGTGIYIDEVRLV